MMPGISPSVQREALKIPRSKFSNRYAPVDLNVAITSRTRAGCSPAPMPPPDPAKGEHTWPGPVTRWPGRRRASLRRHRGWWRWRSLGLSDAPCSDLRTLGPSKWSGSSGPVTPQDIVPQPPRHRRGKLGLGVMGLSDFAFVFTFLISSRK